MNQTYLDTARLLIQIASFVFVDGTFALKGGTAIILIIREMPRLAVDLELLFTKQVGVGTKEPHFLIYFTSV